MAFHVHGRITRDVDLWPRVAKTLTDAVAFTNSQPRHWAKSGRLGQMVLICSRRLCPSDAPLGESWEAFALDGFRIPPLNAVSGSCLLWRIIGSISSIVRTTP